MSKKIHTARPRLRLDALETREVPANLASFLTTEHVDINLGYSGGIWSLQHRDSDHAVAYATDDALLYVGTPALSSRPANGAFGNFDFIGVGAGQDFYQLPQSQDPSLLYLGTAGYGVTASEFDRYNPSTESKGRVGGNGRWLKVKLVDVQHTTPSGAPGDGEFSVWQSGDTGPSVFMSTFNDQVSNPDGSGLDTTDGIGVDDSLWLLAGGHLHYNFGFTQRGRYEVTVKLSGYLGDGGSNNETIEGTFNESQPFKLYFSVGSVGQLEFDNSTYTVNEDAGTASITVRRVNGSDGRIAVNYATSNGSATAGSDYTTTSGTLTFNDQETSKTITVPILDDTTYEGNETVNLTLSNPAPANINDYFIDIENDTNGLIGSQATATLTIIENDPPPNNPPTISDVANQFTPQNTPTGAIAFTVGDIETPAANLTVTATSSNTVIVPNANIVIGGSGANRTVTITPAAGQYGPTTITLTVTDGNGAQSSDTFVLNVTANSLVPFDVPASFSISTNDVASTLASADFNGDGKIDVISVGSLAGSPVLLKGNGDGTFQAGVPIDAGSQIYSRTPTAFDYDGDGDVDLMSREWDDATLNSGAFNGEVVVYLNDGAGNFTRQTIIGGLSIPGSAIQVGDLNGDGRPDFIRFENPTTLVSHESLPGGGYAPQEEIASSFTNLSSTGFRLDDIDADGDLDILAYDTTPRTLSIFLNDGAGNFSAPQQLTFAAATTVRAVADITGDGRLDIVATDTATVYYAQNSDGTFGARTVLSIGSGVTRVVPADLNQDGVVDLIVTQSNALRWAPGRGNGTFGATQVLWSNPGVRPIIALDLDGDGDQDIVVGTTTVNTTLTVLENLTGENPMRLLPPAARTYLGGDPLNLQVHFGFPIAVTGTPRIALQLGANTVYANYVSGAGTPTLTFRYTVGATDVDLDGVQLVTNVIDLNGGTLTNPEGGPAVLTFPGALSGVIVNAPGPLVQMVSRLDSAATSTGTVRFAVQFAEDVTGVDVTDFATRTTEGDLTGAVVQSVTGSGSLYEVTVSTGTGSGTLGLTVLGSASIADLNGDVFSKEYAGGEVYTVREAPIGTIDTYYTDDHADYRPVYNNGDFGYVWHGNSGVLPLTEYSSNELITYLDSTALVPRPAGANFDFLGVNAGEQLFLSNASGSVASVPFMGISGESLKANVFADYKPSDPRITSATLLEYVKVQMVGMRSSSDGDFSIYSTSSGNPTVWMATSDGIAGTDNIWTYPGTHAHYNTAFSKPGTYEVDVVTSGYLDLNANNVLDTADVYVESGIKTMVFHVDTLGARNDAFGVNGLSPRQGDVSLNDAWHAGLGTFTVSVETGPTNGALTLNPNGTFTYTPSGTFAGTDSFVYRLTNERGGFTTATVSITANNPPTISDVTDQATDEDTPTGAISFTVGDAETPVGNLALTATSSDTTLVPNANIVFGGSGANRTVTITPGANAFGTTTITLTVTDADGGTDTDTFLLTVNAVNDSPTISGISDQMTDEDTPTGAISFTVGDAETSADDLVVTATSSNAMLVPDANIVLGGSGANRTVMISPVENAFGTTTITLTVTVADGGTISDTFELAVNSVNDPLLAVDDSYSVKALNTVTGNLLLNDNDIDADGGETAIVTTGPAHGTITLRPDGSFVYTPGSTFTGTDTFVYTATDTGGSSSQATVTVTAAGSQAFESVLTNGDTDIGIAYEGGEWEPHIHAHEADAEYEPNGALFYVAPEALTTRPADASFNFLGVDAGATYYRLPEAENPELLPLGFGTEEIEAGTFTDGIIRLSLKAVNGPGQFSAWLSGDTGPEVGWATSDGITAADTLELLEGGHSHYNFGFSAKGRYEVTMQAHGFLNDGDAIEDFSDEVTYYFSVDNLGQIQFTKPTFGAGEGQTGTITVTRVGGSDGPATVSYATTFGTATAADLDALNGEITFADGETTKTILFTPKTDKRSEKLESATLTLAVPNGSVAQLGTQAATALVIDTPTALKVSSVKINDGLRQRSNIETITIKFSRDTNIPALIESGQISDAIQLFTGTTQVTLAGSRFHYDAAKHTLTIGLTAAGFDPRSKTILANGAYEVRLDTTLLTSAANGVKLRDLDKLRTDGVHRLSFHRLEGDFNGDKKVTKTDVGQLRKLLNVALWSRRYNFAFDLTGPTAGVPDGMIDQTDLNFLNSLLGTTV